MRSLSLCPTPGARRFWAAKPDGVDHQRVALPLAHRRAVEGQVGVLRLRPAVGPDVAVLHVGFGQQHDLVGLQQEFDRIGLGHHPRQPGRHAVGHFALQVLALLLARAERIELRLIFRRQLHLGPWPLRARAAPVGIPDARPVRQLRQSSPLRGGRFDGRIDGDGRRRFLAGAQRGERRQCPERERNSCRHCSTPGNEKGAGRRHPPLGS